MIPFWLERALHIGTSVLLASTLLFRRVYLRPSVSLSVNRTWQQRGATSFARCAGLLWILISLSGAGWLLTVVTSLNDGELSASGVAKVLIMSRFGQLWEIRAGILIVCGAALVATNRRSPSAPASEWTALVASILLVGSLTMTSHAAAAIGVFAPLRFGIDLSHLVVSIVWPGCLFPLALYLRRRDSTHHAEECVSTLRRFSGISLGAVIFLGGTGVANSLWVIRNPVELFDSDYGRVLTLKVMLFLILIVYGAVNRRLLARQARTIDLSSNSNCCRLLARNVWIESLLAAAVFGLVGVLGATASPHLMN
jgi:putative copper export protein